MKLLMCRCTQCKSCRKHKRNQFHITYTKRAGRTRVRQLVKSGQWDKAPVALALGYFG